MTLVISSGSVEAQKLTMTKESDEEKEFLRGVSGQLAYRIARLQVTIITCTNLHRYFINNEKMKPHVDRLFKSLIQDSESPFGDLLESISAVDDFIVEKFREKVEELSE